MYSEQPASDPYLWMASLAERYVARSCVPSPRPPEYYAN